MKISLLEERNRNSSTGYYLSQSVNYCPHFTCYI